MISKYNIIEAYYDTEVHVLVWDDKLTDVKPLLAFGHLFLQVNILSILYMVIQTLV